MTRDRKFQRLLADLLCLQQPGIKKGQIIKLSIPLLWFNLDA